MDSDKKIVYSDDFEAFLKEEGEKAEAMGILHYKSYESFNKLSIGINIPVIILSSIVGFLSPIPLFNDQAIFLGGLSIIIAILKTVDNYFDLTKRSETHRMIALQYNRISKWIQIQLSLERDIRISARDLFDTITNDLQNIRDSEPIVPQDIIEYFNKKYQDEPTSKPSITNGLTNIKINKSSTVPTAIQLNAIVEPKVIHEKPKPFKP